MQFLRPVRSTVVKFVVPKTQAIADAVFVPDLVAALVERYKFWDYPKNNAQFTTEAKFVTGKFGKTNIEAFQIYGNGVSVQAQAKTDELEEIALDFLEFAKSKFSLEYAFAEPLTTTFVSAVEVAVSPEVSSKFEILRPLGERLSMMLAKNGYSVSTYEWAGISMLAEKATPLSSGRFSFEVRAGHPLGGSVYFSEAPVSTSDHLELLGLLEAILTTYDPPPSSQSPPGARAS